MLKKMMLLAAGVSAFVALVPAVASAEGLLHDELNGFDVPVGEQVYGTSANAFVYRTAFGGEKHCEPATFQGEVTQNTESVAEIVVSTGNLVGENCEEDFLEKPDIPITFSQGSMTLRFEKEKQGTYGLIRFVSFHPNLCYCLYEGTTYTYHNGKSDEFELKGTTQSQYDHWYFRDAWTLTKEEGGPVIIEP